MAPVSDHRTLLSGTALNVAGLAAGVVAAYGVQLVFARQLPTGGLGLVTVAVQVAFVAAAGSRFGMDLATVREVAIGVGAADRAHLRSLVERCALIAGAASVVVGLLLVALAPLTGGHRDTIAIAAASVPFAAVANTYLGATRGLKQMSQTLWVYWIGQPLAWIVIAVAAIALGGGTDAAVWSYDASWLLAALAAWRMWRRAAAGWRRAGRPRPRPRSAAVRCAPCAIGAARAGPLLGRPVGARGVRPAGRGRHVLGRGPARPGGAAVPDVAQPAVLAVRRTSTPADTASSWTRCSRARPAGRWRRPSRWWSCCAWPRPTLCGVRPRLRDRRDHAAHPAGRPAVNAATGSVGFILIMVGRTGLDLLDNALAVAVLVGLAAPLASGHGMEGAAIAAAVAIGSVNLIRLVQVHRIVTSSPTRPTTCCCSSRPQHAPPRRWRRRR